MVVTSVNWIFNAIVRHTRSASLRPHVIPLIPLFILLSRPRRAKNAPVCRDEWLKLSVRCLSMVPETSRYSLLSSMTRRRLARRWDPRPRNKDSCPHLRQRRAASRTASPHSRMSSRGSSWTRERTPVRFSPFHTQCTLINVITRRDASRI